jgi:hypothetical protein
MFETNKNEYMVFSLLPFNYKFKLDLPFFFIKEQLAQTEKRSAKAVRC